ncbi:MAG: flagellar basal body protein, partial [Firmicutes bacterium]|nr:flagellar basal body protein [Bacillota bacterium]
MAGGITGLLGQVVGDRTMTLLERGLDIASARHNVLAGNIANANTPGYKRRDISFEGVMREVADCEFG